MEMLAQAADEGGPLTAGQRWFLPRTLSFHDFHLNGPSHHHQEGTSGPMLAEEPESQSTRVTELGSVWFSCTSAPARFQSAPHPQTFASMDPGSVQATQEQAASFPCKHRCAAQD